MGKFSESPLGIRFAGLVSLIFKEGYKEDFMFIFRSSLPLLLSQISQISFQMISVFFCGHMGANEYDGVSLAFTLINIGGMTCVYGSASACDTLFPQIFGGPNKKILGLYLQKAFMISMISCLPIIGLLLNARFLINLVADEYKMVMFADNYILVYLPSIFFVTIITLQIKYLQAQDIVNPVMIIYLIGFVINLALHSLFILGFKWGVEAAALAVDIAFFSVMVMMFVYILHFKIYVDTWQGLSWKSLEDWNAYLKLSIPGFLNLLAEWANFEIATFAASSLGKYELGAMANAQQLLYITFMIPYSIAISGNIRIGHLLGSNSPDRAKNASKVLVSATTMSSIIMFVLLISLSGVIPEAFSSDKEIIKRSQPLMVLCAIYHFLDSLQASVSAIMRTVGAQLFCSIAVFVCYYVIGSPIGLSLLLLSPLKSRGFFVGVYIATTLLIGAQIVYIFKMDWNKKAQEAFDLSKESNKEKVAVNEDIQSMQNPNFLKDGVDPEESKPAPSALSIDVTEDDQNSEGFLNVPKNMKKLLLYRFILVAALIGVLVICACCRGIKLVDHRPVFNSNTTAILSTSRAPNDLIQ